MDECGRGEQRRDQAREIEDGMDGRVSQGDVSVDKS